MGVFNDIRKGALELVAAAVLKIKEMRYAGAGVAGIGLVALGGCQQATPVQAVRTDAITGEQRFDLPLGSTNGLRIELKPKEKGKEKEQDIYVLKWNDGADRFQELPLEKLPTVFGAIKGPGGKQQDIIGAQVIPGTIYPTDSSITMHVIPGLQNNTVDLTRATTGTGKLPKIYINYKDFDKPQPDDLLAQAREDLKRIKMAKGGDRNMYYVTESGEVKTLVTLQNTGILEIKFSPLQKDFTKIDLAKPDFGQKITDALQDAINMYNIRLGVPVDKEIRDRLAPLMVAKAEIMPGDRNQLVAQRDALEALKSDLGGTEDRLIKGWVAHVMERKEKGSNVVSAGQPEEVVGRVDLSNLINSNGGNVRA